MYIPYSFGGQGPGNYAVDGIEDDKMFHTDLTDLDPNPWFEIDLTETQILYKVRLLGRYKNKMGHLKVQYT